MASYKNALGDLSTAIAQLNQAYKAANTIDEKDEIFSMLELLQDEVNEIAGAGLRAWATSSPRRVIEYSSGGLPSVRECSRIPMVCWAISPWR